MVEGVDPIDGLGGLVYGEGIGPGQVLVVEDGPVSLLGVKKCRFKYHNCTSSFTCDRVLPHHIVTLDVGRLFWVRFLDCFLDLRKEHAVI